MNVLLCEPGKLAQPTTINHDLKSMQDIVGGTIEVVYPWGDAVAVVCNDEGLLLGLPLNRKLNEHTIIAGTFFVCGLGREDLSDLPPELMEKYQKLLHYPQIFVSMDGELLGIPYEPEGGDRDE